MMKDQPLDSIRGKINCLFLEAWMSKYHIAVNFKLKKEEGEHETSPSNVKERLAIVSV